MGRTKREGMMRIGALRWIAGSIATGFLGLAGSAFADSTTAAPPNPVQNWGQVLTVLCVFITYFFWFIITVSVIMVMVAAFNYVTAGSDTEKTTKARKTITYAAIGIAVALFAWGFPMIVASLFPQNTVPITVQCS